MPTCTADIVASEAKSLIARASMSTQNVSANLLTAAVISQTLVDVCINAQVMHNHTCKSSETTLTLVPLQVRPSSDRLYPELQEH